LPEYDLKHKIKLSIIIPTFNEAANIGVTLEALKGSGVDVAYDIIVADGGSADATADEAHGHGAMVVDSPRGRGIQLAAGAAQAQAGWLLFIHADTTLKAGWWPEAKAFMDDAANSRKAAAFRFRLDDDCRAAGVLEILVGWRSRWLALPYGDQGLLISTAFYQELGGFAAMGLMEDVDMVRRIGRRRLVLLDADVMTSADKYRREGYLFRPLRNVLCLSLYFLGVPDRTIERLYR